MRAPITVLYFSVLVPATMSRGLERLSEATQTRLRSTQILTSLPQLVSELVQNSLDAGARHVDVGVNCEEYGCWVRDDGCGMGRQDLDALAAGGGGERYGAWLCGGCEGNAEGRVTVSSKVYAPDQIGEQATFGFRGEGTYIVGYMLLYAVGCADSPCCRQRSRRLPTYAVLRSHRGQLAPVNHGP